LPYQGSTSVHRYFEPADSFVEVKLLDAEALELGAPAALDRQSYRRLVIQSCMPQFDDELANDLERLFPEDPLLAEDLLYSICVDVNPTLDIHRVRLRECSTQEVAEPEPMRSRPSQPDPVERLAKVARTLERRLQRKVHGQSQAIRSVCRMVEKAAAGLSAPGRPLGCFLFVGRTGTGKTELARQLAKELGGDRSHGRATDNLIRIDCSEFASAHDYSKLIGSPPGYVGHDEGGQLTRSLEERPGAIVLFDEIEKAHPRMHNLLLQILEEGALTDGRGRRVSFEGHFVILTSNAGADDIRGASQRVGFHRDSQLGNETMQAITDKALHQQFSPEFLGRLDQVILFEELDGLTARSIATDLLTDLAIRARKRGSRVSFTAAVARWVADRGFTRSFGARELRHVIQRDVEPPLARLLLSQAAGPEDLIRARIRGGRLVFTVEH
jgi:ATP-dependent Clp protease ATP-binding subunit ClpC